MAKKRQDEAEIENHDVVILSRHRTRLRPVIALYQDLAPSDKEILTMLVTDIMMQAEDECIRGEVFNEALLRYRELQAHKPDRNEE